MIRKFFLTILLTTGLGDLQFRQARSQVIWKPVEIPKAQSTPLIWENTGSNALKQRQTPMKWEVVPEPEDQNQPSSMVVWEVLQHEDDEFIPPSAGGIGWLRPLLFCGGSRWC